MTDVLIFIFLIVKSDAFRASKSLLPPRCLYTDPVPKLPEQGMYSFAKQKFIHKVGSVCK